MISIKTLTGLTFLVAFISLSVSAYPTGNFDLNEEPVDSMNRNSPSDFDEKTDLDVFGEWLLAHPKFLQPLLVQLNSDEADDQRAYAGSDVDSASSNRSKRRVSVFNNIYQKCRIQKRKDRNLCLYLANLYQNLKGFHGL